MLLADIRLQLQSKGRMPLLELAQSAGVSSTQLLTMLQPWLSKGRIRLLQPTQLCQSSCGKCASSCGDDRWVEWLA